MEYSRTQIDLMQVKPSSLEPYPGPFLEPGIRNRIRTTAFLRSLARPDKKAYRKAAKAATGEAMTYAQRNCSKYFEFQFVWPELMARVENDKILRTALLQSAANRQASGAAQAGQQPSRQASVPPANVAAAGIDPGSTTEIRLNIAD